MFNDPPGFVHKNAHPIRLEEYDPVIRSANLLSGGHLQIKMIPFAISHNFSGIAHNGTMRPTAINHIPTLVPATSLEFTYYESEPDELDVYAGSSSLLIVEEVVLRRESDTIERALEFIHENVLEWIMISGSTVDQNINKDAPMISAMMGDASDAHIRGAKVARIFENVIQVLTGDCVGSMPIHNIRDLTK